MCGGIPWTTEDEATLKSLYPKKPAKYIAKKLKRSVDAITTKAKKLGVKNKRCNAVWTRKELLILKDGWADSSMRWLQDNLPGRTMTAIILKSRKLKLGRRLQGYMAESKAAKLIGMHIPEFLLMAELEGLQYKLSRRLSSRKNSFRYYEEMDVRDAAARYLRRENMVQACMRIGVSGRTLWTATKRLDIPHEYSRKRWRLLPEEWDSIYARWQEQVAITRARVAQNLRRMSGAAPIANCTAQPHAISSDTGSQSFSASP